MILCNPPLPLPWYRSPWAIGAGVVLGGLALGGAVGALVRARRRSALPPADCSLVSGDGGSIGGIRYLERIRGGAHPDEPLPMVVVFHSRGANPEGFAGMLGGIGRARLILPEGDYGSGHSRSWFELPIREAVEGDPGPVTEQWRVTAERIRNFIGQMIQCRPTVGLPLVTGSSQGGEMTLLVASTSPDLVAGGVAVSGWLLPAFWTADMAPVSMLHGTGDQTVPYAWAADYAAQMQGKGAPISFTGFPSEGHAITKAMSNAWIGSVRAMVAEVAGASSAAA